MIKPTSSTFDDLVFEGVPSMERERIVAEIAAKVAAEPSDEDAVHRMLEEALAYLPPLRLALISAEADRIAAARPDEPGWLMTLAHVVAYPDESALLPANGIEQVFSHLVAAELRRRARALEMGDHAT